jgi:hypothetical protein
MPQNRGTLMKLLDPDDPFFGKTWVRVVTVAAPFVWSLVEFLRLDSPGWGIVFLAASVYAAWILFFNRKSED